MKRVSRWSRRATSADGQPPTPVQVAAFLAKLDSLTSGSVTAATTEAGLTPKQLEELAGSDPTFALRLREFENRRNDSLIEKAYQIADRGDPGMVRFLLEYRHPEFRKEAKGKGGALNLNLTAEDLKKLSDSELEELRRRLEE